MKKIFLPITFSILTLSAFAQQPDSLLKQFKYRIDHFRAVGISASSGSQFDKTDLPAGTHKNNYFSGGLGGSYYAIKSTDKILFTASASMFGSYHKVRSEDQNTTNTGSNIAAAPQISVLNKWFSKKLFTELGADVSGSLNTDKSTITGFPGATINKETQCSMAVNMGIGKGRLENVTDMQNALWLYKELVKVGRLPAALSAADLNDLGKSITKGNKTRVLDARKKTQFLLTSVDDYLQQKGLISKNDMTYFSNLNDILLFAFNTQRLSGKEKFIRLTPGIAAYKTDNSQNDNFNKHKETSTVPSFTFSTGINKYTPTSLTHQNNFGVALKFFYASLDYSNQYYTSGVLTSETKTHPNLKQASVDVFFQHAIYPNTRTIINFNLQAQGGYQDVNTQSNWFGKTDVSASWDYFISYRTRLQINVGGIYRKNITEVTRYFEERANNFIFYANAGIAINI